MIRMDFSSLKETKPHQYALRFVFGGICTVLAGLIAKRYGPGLGGLFLAFPAIFPAGASLIESHEKKRKAQHGFDGTKRGRLAASIDALGASLGCLGLMAFAFTLWIGLPEHTVRSASLWSLPSFGLESRLCSGPFIGIGSFISEMLTQIIRAIRFDDFTSLRIERWQHQRRYWTSMQQADIAHHPTARGAL